MNKKFFLGWVLIFIAWMAGSFVVHALILKPEYAQLSHMFRSGQDGEHYFPFMLLAHVMLAGVFVWLYRVGLENKPWPGQGVRYGIVIALLNIVPTYLIYYAVQTMPGMLVTWQIALDSLLMLLLGILVAFWYRNLKK